MDKNELFSSVKFVVAECKNAQDIRNLLIEGGATHINYLSESVTHVISDRNCLEVEEAVELYDKPVVRSLWVHLSLRAKKLLPTEAFSPVRVIFTNIVASFSANLSTNDVEILASTITFYGGQVSKNSASCTHHIVTSAEPSEFPDKSQASSNLKFVTPDWILESVKQNRCCDEQLYDPELLLPPPAPAPPPAPPLPQQQQQLIAQPQDPKKPEAPNQTISTESERLKVKVESPLPQHPQNKLQSQPSQPSQGMQTLPQSQLPRARMPANIVRIPPPRFRPLLPPSNNAPMAQRPLIQQPRVIGPDPQQPKKVTINYGQYRKMNPYQGVVDPQHHGQVQQQLPTYVQAQRNQHVPSQQTMGNMTQVSRLPQPTIYHQVRVPYQGNHLPSRGPMQQQTPQTIRFQDPNGHTYQRPYQICLQPQIVNSNYQQGMGGRQQIYYPQNTDQMQVRMPQQGGPIRHPSNDQMGYENFSPGHPQESMSIRPHTYHGRPSGNQQAFTHSQQLQPPQNHQLHHPCSVQQPPTQMLQSQSPQQLQHPRSHQVHPQQVPQHQPAIPQTRPQFHPNFPGSSQRVSQVGPTRPAISEHQELKTNSLRPTNPDPSGLSNQKQANSTQPKPYPSIFDSIQESNLALIKVKVPNVTENIEYFGHDPKANVPKDLPLMGCVFKLADYECVDSNSMQRWRSAIEIAGGSFDADIQKITHLICETRLSNSYCEALKLGKRCVTIYWVNDVLAHNHMTFPWKALHLPLPFSKDNKPLSNQVITITNIKGKDRREVKEMILKTGAIYTDYFSPSNTLVICGNVGGEKYEHAVEWKIPIANCQILTDTILGVSNDLDSMLSQSKYQLFKTNDILKLSSYSDVRDLMQAWTKPVIPTERKDSIEFGNINDGAKASTISLNANEDSGVTIGGGDNSVRAARKSNEPIRLLVTHLEAALVEQLESYAMKLDMSFANSPVNCTHLIVDRICRTPKFICAFSHANYILSYKWILESHEANQILDERHFILQDELGEEKYSFNLAYSLLKRKKRAGPLFNNFVFFVTPSVLSSVTNVKEMIESAGGVVATKKLPSRTQINHLKASGKRLIVVTCSQDFHLCSMFESSSVDIVNVEFVISGILRQDIDFEAHRETFARPKRLRLVEPQ